MSIVTGISCDNPIAASTNGRVGRRASGFVQVGLRPPLRPISH
jgi:hypothetical protein